MADRLESIVSREKKLANVLYTLYELDVEEDKIKLVLPEGIKEENFHYLKGMLTLNLQHESYVKNLMKILNQVKADIDVQLKEFRKVLDAIHEVVQYRTAVPTEKVFVSMGFFLRIFAIDCILLFSPNLHKYPSYGNHY